MWRSMTAHFTSACALKTVATTQHSAANWRSTPSRRHKVRRRGRRCQNWPLADAKCLLSAEKSSLCHGRKCPQLRPRAISHEKNDRSRSRTRRSVRTGAWRNRAIGRNSFKGMWPSPVSALVHGEKEAQCWLRVMWNALLARESCTRFVRSVSNLIYNSLVGCDVFREVSTCKRSCQLATKRKTYKISSISQSQRTQKQQLKRTCGIEYFDVIKATSVLRTKLSNRIPWFWTVHK